MKFASPRHSGRQGALPMQYPLQKEPDSNPVPAPQPGLADLSAKEPKGSGRKWAVVGTVVVLIVAGAMYALRGRLTSQTPPSQLVAQTRVAPATKTDLTRTMRLSGTTQPVNYATLRAPAMRGRRGPSGSASFGSSSRISLPGTGTSLTIRSNAGSSSTFRTTTNRFDSSSGDYTNSATSSSDSSGDDSSTDSTSSSSSSSGSSGSVGRSAGGGVFASIGGGGGGRHGGDFSQVLDRLVAPGSRVKKGDVVAGFDNQYMETRLDDFRASVEQDKSGFERDMVLLETQRKAHQLTIEEAKAALEKAQLDVKTIPVRSDIDAERLQLAAQEAQAKYDQLLREVKYVNLSADAQVSNAKLDIQTSALELQRAERNMDQMEVRAPIDGITVMETNFRGTNFSAIKEGDEVFPGQPFMKIVDPSKMRVEANVNQADAQRLRMGMKARIRFDAYPGLELPGTLIGIGAMAVSEDGRTQSVKQVPVFFQLDKMDTRALPDLSVSADVLVDSAPAAVTVPREAVFYDAAREASYVYVKKGTRFERQYVETGLSNYLRVAIVNGLNSGEVVALELPPARVRETTLKASVK